MQQSNKEIYQDTIKNGHRYPYSKSVKITSNDIIKRYNSSNNTSKIFYLYKTTIKCARYVKTKSPNCKILIHNFANNDRPCDDLIIGNTQEEQLFRRTNLGLTLNKSSDLYPICKINQDTRIPSETNVLYTPIVSIFKDDQNNYINPHIEAGVVSSAAAPAPRTVSPTCISNYFKYDYFYPEERRSMSEKIHLMLSVAEKNNYDIFITGAWGLGAFCNPLFGLTQLWKHIIPEYNINVIFAIPDKELCNEFRHFMLLE